MENLKIKVSNEAESKEAQELFFELGYEWHGCGKKVYYLNEAGGDFTHLVARQTGSYKKPIIQMGCGKEDCREITLQELRNMVLEQQIAAHDILAQREPKLFLDPKQNYAEIEWDGSFLRQDHWVEVPEGANFYCNDYFWLQLNSKKFWNGQDWQDDESTLLSFSKRYKNPIVWQRTQDEPFLTPESVVASTHGLARDWENRNTSGSIKLMPRNSTESISIHGTINPKPDLSPQEAALDVQIGGNHYKKMKIQPVEFALANNLDFCQGSAIKYILRHADKNGREDLEKAKHFIDLMIEHYYG